MNPLGYVSKSPYPLYIDGRFLPSASGRTFPILNPVTGEQFAQAYLGGAEDVQKAILAARRAFDQGPWGRASNRELACLETLDCGKLYASVMGFEAPNAVEGLRYHAAKALGLEGKVVPVAGGGRTLNYVLWQPRGVVGEILPWNGPLMMGCQKISAILAAGNTVVVKPSSWASLSLLALAGIFHEAGFPPGVVNVVTGHGSEVGEALARSPLVDMVSLTGGRVRVTGKDTDLASWVPLVDGDFDPVNFQAQVGLGFRLWF